MAKAGSGKPPAQGDPAGEDLKIILWANGFQVQEDGPLRPYDDPMNQKFMAELKEGRVPQEIAQ